MLAFFSNVKKMKQHNCYGQLVKPPFMLIPKFATLSSSSSSKTFFSIGFDDMDSLYASPEDFKNMKHRNRTRGLHLLEYFVNRCHEIGVACEAWMKKGDPKEVICHEVKRVQPDLLVVGSRGLGPFQRVFVGTVSEFCQKHAECPVISIKRRADETPQDPVDD
ncbi:PREDICTED: universal stress protein A-like protein isoform X4 [Populus euphratica]|uniref:Universal stress protein A-like protein isoform X4 n=1 Tax=Populus euphratica TaxID=75702 RepID=A0AAJ6TJ85_POPEU|nr:PREDICTED: universal stress protein A-like protein isoform X4 [Populus euphratica]